ncbi:MAG: tetratricopeptide repeat protein [Candidatus Kapabacteria bacterium]|nr:tetratricopeptide repeat protein [Candidatus Kapabacteria bacterium]
MNKSSHSKLFETLLHEAKTFMEDKNLDLALNKAFEAYFLLQEETEIDISIDDQLEAYIVLASLNVKTGNPLEGKKLLERAVILAEGRVDSNSLGRIYGLLAQFEILVSELELALQHFEKAIDLYEEEGNTDKVMKTFGNKAILLDMMGKRSEALETFIKVSSYFSENSQDMQHIIALVHIANIFEVMGTYRSAIANLSIAATLLSSTENFALQSRIKANLSYLYLLLGDEDASKEYMNLANEDLKKSSNEDIHTVYLGIYQSEILKYHQQFEEAKVLALKTLDLTLQNKYTGLTIQTYIDLATISLHLKDNDKAEEYLNSAIALSHSSVYKTYMVNIFHSFALLSNAKGELENAKMYCALGIDEAKRQNLNPVLEELSQLYSTLQSSK